MANYRSMDFPWKASEHGRMAWFLDQSDLHGGGMATAPRQSAPGAPSGGHIDPSFLRPI